MSDRRRIGWSLVTALVAEVVNKASPLLVLYFAQSRLHVTSFGESQFALASAETFIPFVAWGYSGIASIEIGERAKDKDYARGVIGNVMALKLLHLLAVLAIGALVALTARGGTPFAVYAAASILLFASALDTDYVHLGSQTMAARNLFAMLAKALGVLGVVLCVRSPEDQVLYAGFAALPAFALSALSALYNVRRYPPERPSLAAMRRLFRLAIPFGLFGFLFTLADRFDVLLVERLLGPGMTGIYSGQMRLVQSIMTATGSVGLIFYAEMVARTERTAFSRLAYQSLWAMLTLVAPIVGGIWFVDRSVLQLMYGEAFLPYAGVLDVLVLSAALQVFVQVLGNQVLIIKRQVARYNVLIAVGIAVGAVVALTLATPLGVTGIALGNLAAKVVTVTLFFVAARAHLDRFPWGEVARVFAPAALMALALAALGSGSLWANVGVGAVVFAASFALLNRRTLVRLSKRG